MSIVSNTSKSVVRGRAAAASAGAAETSEYDGFWINVGAYMGEGDDAKFVRLPRGVAVSDLKVRKVYETMDPDFAAQVEMMNEMILAIQNKCLAGNKGKALAEGQSVTIKLSAVLYRRQEEAELAPNTELSTNVARALFDDDEADEEEVEAAPKAKAKAKVEV